MLRHFSAFKSTYEVFFKFGVSGLYISCRTGAHVARQLPKPWQIGICKNIRGQVVTKSLLQFTLRFEWKSNQEHYVGNATFPLLDITSAG